MFDKNTVRLQKNDRGLKPLPFVVWTDDSVLPKPESIGPFDGTRTYVKDDIISSNEETLLYCIREPERGYARPEIDNISLPNSTATADVKMAKIGDTHFIIASSNFRSRVVDKHLSTPVSASTGGTFIYKWQPTESTPLLLVNTIATLPLENITVFTHGKKTYLTGARGLDSSHNAAILELNEDGSTTVVCDLPDAEYLYYYQLGTRHFFLYGNYDEELISLIQFSPETESVSPVTSYLLQDTEELVDISTLIIGGDIFLALAIYDSYRGKSVITTLRFDNSLKSLNFVSDHLMQDEITYLQFKEIDSITYLITCSVKEWVMTHRFEKGIITSSVKLPKTFDYKGTDIDIQGIVDDLSFFKDGDKQYMNVPVLSDPDAMETDMMSVTCFWDATVLNFVPFKAIPTKGIYRWPVLEMDEGIYSIACNYTDELTFFSPVFYGWDTITKKFTTQLSEIVGGSEWNPNDWRELQTGTALVAKHSTSIVYRPDMYILDDADKILRHKKPKSLGPFIASDWEEIHPKQVIRTMHFFPKFNLAYGQKSWSYGTLVPITY